MKKIFKYHIREVGVPTTVPLPDGAVIVHVHTQNDTVCFWALVDPSARPILRTFVVYGTGWEMHDNVRYVGTSHAPPFVWHLFELAQTTIGSSVIDMPRLGQ